MSPVFAALDPLVPALDVPGEHRGSPVVQSLAGVEQGRWACDLGLVLLFLGEGLDFQEP
jgi:hypothetical protein